MPRLIARLLLVVLVLLSSSVMPVPSRAGKSRACCAAKSSCSMMRTAANGAACCALPERSERGAHADEAPVPEGACVLAVSGCGPAALTPPTAPIVFQFLVPLEPVTALSSGIPLVSPVADEQAISAEPGLRPRPPQLPQAPEHRA